ncbi:hypothetical protein FIBSPDRAFT_462848 [Athelia psychrophila]|uniref:Uncharacterized protein n=1 Tax=Athelia psychrophila TaxID=1759441 RepID=A0A166LML3_9AGAM|nr:hypothetical protein FIBSPDRAFT_462848 [Fibularhizoctonia sp. CBS 109695]
MKAALTARARTTSTAASSAPRPDPNCVCVWDPPALARVSFNSLSGSRLISTVSISTPVSFLFLAILSLVFHHDIIICQEPPSADSAGDADGGDSGRSLLERTRSSHYGNQSVGKRIYLALGTSRFWTWGFGVVHERDTGEGHEYAGRHRVIVLGLIASCFVSKVRYNE